MSSSVFDMVFPFLTLFIIHVIILNILGRFIDIMILKEINNESI
nr:MAG TPA: hypothetical protein [Caudoviricetes sp.]